MTFTIFTGTYNSEKIIHRVFNSIKNQTLKDFEWIVIDDNSHDNTVALLNDLKQKHPDLNMIVICHKKNTGVAVSRREAINLAKGKYFVTWDHDDEQVEGQLEVFLNMWDKYGDTQIANIFAKMTDQEGVLLGKNFPSDAVISDYISMHNAYLVKTGSKVVEHHVCVKTDKFLEVIKYYEAHNYLLEGKYPNGGDVWGMMAYLGYKTIYTNSIVRKYYTNETGRSSMSSGKRKDRANRVFRNKLLWVNYFDTKLSFWHYPRKLRNIFAVVMYGLLAKKSIFNIENQINNNFKRLLAALFFLPAFLMARKFIRE